MKKTNTFLEELKADGTLDDMFYRWVIEEDERMPEIPKAKNPKRTLVVATTGTVEPYTYYEGTRLTGYDIELARRFAAWLGVGLTFQTYDWTGLLSATQAGKADCIMSNLYYRPEYAESIDFSEPLFNVEVTAMVKDQEGGGGVSFWSSVRSSFKRTFLNEDRWKLFVSGMCTTLLITVLSILFGSLLGFSVFMACRHGNRIANSIAGCCVWLVQGLPVVVLLMILYYLVFGSLNISGTIVSIISFTLIFGAWVYARIKTGIAAVDIGQTKAAYALGYTDRQTFYKVVLPQAMPYIIPPFKGDITALLKATAVVGYIAVQDLTKMADIVRSRTYEAFFPLISIAVIYLILEELLLFIVYRIEPWFNPKRRKREDILKGVKHK